MQYALIREDNHRVAGLAIVDSPDGWTFPEGYYLVEAEGFDPQYQICEYEYSDGEFVHIDPAPAPLEAVEVLTALFAAEPENLDVLPDGALARMAPYMQLWEPGAVYQVGNLRQYLENPYRCLQAHTSQESWNPVDAPSLWAKVLIPDPSVIPEWEQPGSTNPYMKGDKVKHNGKTWVSDVDNNVWEPGVYGWTEYA